MKKLFINVVEPAEARIAIVEGEKLHSFFLERTEKKQKRGNIYKGIIKNIEEGIQGAFVDIGNSRNGFLHVSDVIFPDAGFKGILKKSRRRKKNMTPKDARIGDMLKVGQEVLVQITREEIESKGPSLTTFLSLPGRYLVITPESDRVGVSRKIKDPKLRSELKSKVAKLKKVKNTGIIIRTAGKDQTVENLNADLNYLKRLWREIRRRTKKANGPTLVYEEANLITRTIRDYFTDDINKVLIDSKEGYEEARRFVNSVMPKYKSRIHLYSEKGSLFGKYRVEDQIEETFRRVVKLDKGGSLIIEQTSACVTIDVNSGKFKDKDSETTSYKVNMTAADEICRQLRLRDLGGLVMVDFIDMEEAAHRRKVEQQMKNRLKQDKCRVQVLPISQLGIMEMTRQRMHDSIKRSIYDQCPTCNGTGMIKSMDTISIEFRRAIRKVMTHDDVAVLETRLNPMTASYVSNKARSVIANIEEESHVEILVGGDPELSLDEIRIWGKSKKGKVLEEIHIS